ncbi:MAG: glycosyltransferase family 4 protein, partial [Cytophagaceae bacterium]
MKILYISSRVPFPPTDGGAIVTYTTVTEMAKAGHEVHLLALNTLKHHQPESVIPGIAYQQYVDIDTSVTVKGAFFNLFKSSSYNVERFISPNFSNALAELLLKNHYDLIQVEGTYVAWYVDIIREYAACPVVLRAHNIEYIIWERLAENCRNFFKKNYLHFLARRLRKFETEYLSRFDGIAAITQQDADRIKGMGIISSCKVIPVAVRLKELPAAGIVPKPFSIFILSSLDWLPNQEGVLWFLEHVWPAVLKEMPQMELHIAGKNTPESFYRLSHENMVVHGFVNDSFEFMNQHDLMLVPLLSGGGMRVKIIEGMAAGKVILASAVAAEGIKCEHGKNILVADKPEEWINTILDYFHDRKKYQAISGNARKVIEAEYSSDRITAKFVDFYKDLMTDF